MKSTDDLLNQFRATGSERAFRELVEGYVDLVYSAALRGMNGDAHAAEDVTQKVFVDLARLAAGFPAQMLLGGWLHRHTCFVAGTMRRGEQRRAAREREAMAMNLLQADSTGAHWADLAPVLDEAINQLDDAERDALVLRFFEQRDFKSVGATLGISDDAAQKRVSRALDRLRTILQARGIGTATAALGALLTAQGITAAPAGLATQASAQALAGHTVATTASAGILGLSLAALLKWGAVAATITFLVGTAGVWLTPSPVSPEAKAPAAPVASATPQAKEAPAAAAPDPVVKATTLPEADTNLLRLTFVSTDSGAPVPNVQVEAMIFEGPKWSRKKFTANRLGVCDIPLTRASIKQLDLISQVDGFADTRLKWFCNRGDIIEPTYNVQLDRAVPIAGRVVDADGKPVAGAKVGFNHSDKMGSSTGRQSHEFGWIETQTDQDGRWRINRMAAEMIGRIYGSARHEAHTQSQFIWVERSTEAKAELLAGRHVFALGRAVTLQGEVVDARGNPISQARVLAGMLGESNSRKGTSDAHGRFTLAGCVPGNTLLTAEADGYAATTLAINSSNSQAYRLILQPGQILRLRVVKASGEPVPNARAWLNTRQARLPGAPSPAQPPVQSEFDPTAGPDGRIVWSNAPNQELVFDITGAGMMRLNDFKVMPDGEEHMATLTPGLTIKGTVKDARTGQPIPRFRIVTGWMKDNPITGEQMPHWSTLERFWLSFSGGKFDYTYQEAVLNGGRDYGYVFRIEAEGYAAHITRGVATKGGNRALRCFP